MRTSALLLVIALTACGSSSSDARKDAGVSPPQGSVRLAVDTAGCAARADSCTNDADELADLWAAVRNCAPSSVANVCDHRTTIQFTPSGCAEAVYIVEGDAAIAGFNDCVVARVAGKRWSCLRTTIRLGDCP